MYVYSIQQILDMRSLYKEAPYPGFSLEEACRRKKMRQTKLVRGPNAWAANGSAKSVEEWVERLVQSSLNKLSSVNFDGVVEKLQTDVIFNKNDTLNKTVELIFKKALDEPENSNLYARVCYKLAEFEVGLSGNKQATKDRKHSKLRNAVVNIAQEEFQNRRKMPFDDGLTEEEIELRRTSFMRRKRANMKFIGELFMCNVLSHNTMMSIIHTIMQEAEKGGHPTSEDIEFLMELLLTIGESLDAIPKLATQMDSYFQLLGILKDQKNVYPPRICFKMLDLIELRSKFKWGRRAGAVPLSFSSSKGNSTAQREPMRVTDKHSGKTASSLNTAATSPSAAKKGKQVVSLAPTSSATAAGVATSRIVNGESWRSIVKPSVPPAKPAVVQEAEPVSFKKCVSTLFNGWVGECTGDFIPEWMNSFRQCQQTFKSDEELCKAVAKEVVREACMTTKKDAQREASSFLVVGLYMADVEVFDGFAMALASAIEEGILEDVPKFSERFINMLRITSGENALLDVYYDAARVLCTAYGMIQDTDTSVLDTLMDFWGKMPRPTADEKVIFSLPVLQSLGEMSTRGQAPLLGRIIFSLHTTGLVDDEVIRQWLALPSEGVTAVIFDAFKKAAMNV